MIFLKQLIKYFFVAYLLQIAVYSYAQEYTYRHYGVEEGLPSSEIYQAFQDSKGYIWFATDMGVSRFSGYEFTNFDIESGLPNNTIFEIFEDLHGKIWFLSLLNKLSYYNNDTITQYKYNKIIKKHTGKKVLSIKRSFFIDSLDNVFLSVRSKGICKISKQGAYTNLQKNDRNSTLRIIKVSDKILAGFINKDNDYEHVIYKNIVVSVKNSLTKKRLTHSSHYFTALDLNNKTILITDKNSIYRLEENNKLTKLKTFNYDILWFSRDHQNRYWVSIRNNGIFCFKNNNFSIENSTRFLKNKSISSILIDNNQGYWFSTLSSGVYYLPTFELKTINETINKDIHNISVGAEYILAEVQRSEFLVLNKQHVFLNKVKTAPTNLVNKIIYDEKNNSFWIATNYFVHKLNPSKINPNRVYKPLNTYKLWKTVKSMALDAESGIWVGWASGLFRVKDNKTIYNSANDEWQEFVYSIVPNPDGSLWLGTLNGLWKYKNGEFINFGEQNKLLKHRITSLLKYKNKLYIGTKGVGLIIYNLNNNKLRLILKKDGLTSNSITDIANYKDKICIGTNKGLNILSLNDKNYFNITQFDKGNGLLSDEINQLLVSDSVLYIASKKGINYLNLDKFRPQNKILTTYIEKVRIRSIDTTLQKEYILNHKQDFISISYKAISFKNDQNVLYRYKMYPIVTNWTYTYKNELQFTSLNPGTYKFMVSAQNKSGKWNQANTTLSFEIETPFWLNWWFTALFTALFIISVIALVNSKLNRVQKENRLKKELNLYMKKAINAQINPHFLFNSLNSINQYILQNDKLNSSKYLNRFSIYIRSILNALKNDFQSLSEELKISELYLELEKFRLKEKLSYSLKVDSSVKSRNILIPTMVITPFLENAIWFGILPQKGLGKIEIFVSQENSTITISIKDNGIGRKESLNRQNNPDFNLKNPSPENTFERIKLLNDLYSDRIDISYIDLNEGTNGTIVNIKIKVTSDKKNKQS